MRRSEGTYCIPHDRWQCQKPTCKNQRQKLTTKRERAEAKREIADQATSIPVRRGAGG